jgi:hypothetical protein
MMVAIPNLELVASVHFGTQTPVRILSISSKQIHLPHPMIVSKPSANHITVSAITNPLHMSYGDAFRSSVLLRDCHT